jgi:hypothetical protein
MHLSTQVIQEKKLEMKINGQTVTGFQNFGREKHAVVPLFDHASNFSAATVESTIEIKVLEPGLYLKLSAIIAM